MLKAKVKGFTVYWPNHEVCIKTALEALGRVQALVASGEKYVLVMVHE